jgi:hypothetical protein
VDADHPFRTLVPGSREVRLTSVPRPRITDSGQRYKRYPRATVPSSRIVRDSCARQIANASHTHPTAISRP